MSKVKANGLQFFYQRFGGDAPTVVFIHGLVIDNLSSWWYTVGNAAAAQGADVVCYDLRGHGMSERPLAGYSTADNLSDLVGILDELGIDHPVHVVGNSYGGVIGMALAVAHPERVASLVLVEAHVAVDTHDQAQREQVAVGLDLAGLLLTEDEVNDWLDTVGGRKLNRMARNARQLIFDTSLIADLRGSSHFTEGEIAGVTQPALLVFGEHSDIYDRGVMLRDLLPAGSLHVVADVDHSVLMGATPEVRRIILDWLAGGFAGG